ncbi:hypothetical protein HD554DRAFT_2176421 [Boletus coccyginus]|nr:hypothetical protein HD554DRAFT_2176421 [Boletus coccyginus]
MDPSSTPPPIIPGFYKLNAESLAFYKSTTGIHDDDQLKEHILDVQERAYAAAPYPCIRFLSFLALPVYNDVLKLGQEREGALFLDLGCGLANAARKLALDGFPAKQIIASDLNPELWDFGHVLFRSTPDSFPATFLAGDVFDPAFLSPFKSGSAPLTEVNLSNISTLNELRGNVSVIWASSLFHLFPEEGQRRLAHAVGRLLSPEKGSVIFGIHMGLPSKGTVAYDTDVKMFCHDPESWKEMWVARSTIQNGTGVDAVEDMGDLDEAVFPSGSVKLDAKLVPIGSKTTSGLPTWRMMWSVTRV